MKLITNINISGRLFILIAGLLLCMVSCKKDGDSIRNSWDTITDQTVLNFHTLKITVLFNGYLKPKAGDEIVINTYFSEVKSPDFGNSSADREIRMKLSESQIQDGFTVTDTVFENPAFVYVGSYVDINNDSLLSKGDLAVFYEGLDYDNVLNGSATPVNINKESEITLNMNKVKGFVGTKHSVEIKIGFHGDLKPQVGDKLVINGFYTDNKNPDFSSISPSVTKEINLSQDQIDEGFIFTDSIPNQTSFAYLGAYVDIDGNGDLNIGDLAAFYDNKPYDSVMNGAIFPVDINGVSRDTMNLGIIYGLYGDPLDVDIQFTGELKPEAGNKVVLNVYYPETGNPDFTQIAPDVIKKVELTVEQITNGLTIKDTIPYNKPFAYIVAYVDINDNGVLNDGDLAIFNNNKDYDDVLNALIQPDNVKNESQISLDINRAKGYGVDYVMDYDRNLYHIVKIGDQIWMADNLRVTHYRNGDAIPTGFSDADWVNTTDGAYSIYPFGSTSGVVSSEQEMAEKYGLLYNAYAVLDPRELAPEGWRVATDDDWKELEINAGMTQEVADETGSRGEPVGDKLKATAGWGENNGTDDFGFSIVPAGNRNVNGKYASFGSLDIFWTSTPSATQPDRSIRRYVKVNVSYVARDNYYNYLGFSVRCVKE